MSILSSLRKQSPLDDNLRSYVDTPGFSYKKWLDDSYSKGSTSIAKLGTLKPRIAVIGAGAAGLCAAYELQQCGLPVDVFEASDRAGGRLYSYNNNDTWQGPTVAELGAMRFPFSEKLLFRYLDLADPGQDREKKYPPFPDPGVVNTLISYRDEQPFLWTPNADSEKLNTPPPGFEKVSTGWSTFVGACSKDDIPIFSKDTNLHPNLTKLGTIEYYLSTGTPEDADIAKAAWQV